jgi:hypothetical protein
MQNANVQRKSETLKVRPLRTEVPLSDLHNATVQKGVGIWQRMRGARPFPSRADMSPRQLSDLLRNTALVRVICAGEYELRIVGDALVQAQGQSFQGMTMTEIDLVLPGHGSILTHIYNTVIERAAPISFRGWYHREADGRSLFHETAVLPLASAGNVIDHLIVFGAYAFTADEKLR